MVVGPDANADFPTVSAAIASGAKVIRIQPGTYREVLNIPQSGIQLRGTGARPQDVVLTYNNSAGTAGGTTKSASITVSGDDFYAENLTIENSFSRNQALKQEGSQAVALKISGDRAVFRKVRFLGYQDTLYPTSKHCESDKGPCEPARQYFSECYIEGNVDFIFGDAMAFFDRCEIHALAHSTIIMLYRAEPPLRRGEKRDTSSTTRRITAEPRRRPRLSRPPVALLLHRGLHEHRNARANRP